MNWIIGGFILGCAVTIVCFGVFRGIGWCFGRVMGGAVSYDIETRDPDEFKYRQGMRHMPEEIVAWPSSVSPRGETALAGLWSARRHYTDEAVRYVREDMKTLSTTPDSALIP
jgi:hypothetical protein